MPPGQLGEESGRQNLFMSQCCTYDRKKKAAMPAEAENVQTYKEEEESSSVTSADPKTLNI